MSSNASDRMATGSWMWADAKTGFLATWNPLRWSPRASLSSLICDIRSAGAGYRPVSIQLWEKLKDDGTAPIAMTFSTAAEAIDHLATKLQRDAEAERNGSASTIEVQQNVSTSASSRPASFDYGALDTQTMSLPELAGLGRLIVDSQDFEICGLHAFPRLVQDIEPSSWVFGKLRSCAASMVSGHAEQASEGLVHIATRALQGESKEEAGPAEAELAAEIVTSLLLNLGGQLQAKEVVTERLKHFITLGLKCYNECRSNGAAAKDVLRESACYSLSTVAHALAEVLGQDGASDMLLVSLPAEAPPLAAGQEKRLRELILSMVAALAKVTITMPTEMTDAEALCKLRQISRCVLSAAAVLTVSSADNDVSGVDAIVALAAAWIRSFFGACIGVAPSALNAQRLMAFLEIGREVPSAFNQYVLEETHTPLQQLQDMGVSVSSLIGDEMISALLKRLREAQADQEEELFTACPLVGADGRVVKNLTAVCKTSRGSCYVFLYDGASLERWSNQDGTLPETREQLDAPNVNIWPIS